MTDWSIGSRWCRWDPHLHTPGTLRNDQFKGDWNRYLLAIEQAAPAPAALGITDYFTMEGYKAIRAHKAQGRLPSVDLIFPNIEMRLSVETRKGPGINLHLLVSPHDPEHIDRVEGLLGRLSFRGYRGQTFSCTLGDLSRLGRLHADNEHLEEQAARRIGANQFKVDWRKLQQELGGDRWFQENVLVAVAAGEDGLAGIGRDAGFSAEREALGDFADIIFSGSPNDRSYWAGHHDDFKGGRRATKPCLHGSDAHSMDRILAPKQDRRCWIRAEPTFDGLRQTLVEPERRVHIGPDAPPGPSPDNVIRTIEVRNAPWMQVASVELNDGLVTIIGAKGSGKTALADLAAFGAHAEDGEPGPASFIKKAEEHLDGVSVQLEWADGSRSSAVFGGYNEPREPRVRYLSQQFVERLCSNARVSQPLVDEIEAVVFSAIPEENRMWCSSFAELREVELRDLHAERDDQRNRIRRWTESIGVAHEEQRALEGLRTKHAEAVRLREATEKALQEIPAPSDPKVAAAHELAAKKLADLKERLALMERRGRTLADLEGSLDRLLRAAEDRLQGLQEQYADLELTEDQWQLQRLHRKEGAAEALKDLRLVAENQLQNLRAYGVPTTPDPEPDAPAGLAHLVNEEARLAKLLGADRANAKKRAKLQAHLPIRKRAESDLLKRAQHAEKAPERRKEAAEHRLEAYERLFATLVGEQQKLEALYSPLRDQLPDDGKLSFYVHRRVDAAAWASHGERILDLRRPPFSGRGALQQAAEEHLVKAWATGTPAEVRAALTKFLRSYGQDALKARLQGVSAQEFGDWVFSTDHVHVEYGISYEEVPIPRLSPGTRGVVLLTLYLGLDRWDERPLIIDQPEENLDPKSVFADLVPFFREASTRRQIIMVTHNANLVVNTDSDQVIITSSVRSDPAKLPDITYVSGGLEDSHVRGTVCSLLEGGEEAFRRRGRRYGVPQ